MNIIKRLLLILLLSPSVYIFAGEKPKVPYHDITRERAEAKIDKFFASLVRLKPEEAMSRIDHAVNNLIGEAKDLQDEVISTHKQVVSEASINSQIDTTQNFMNKNKHD